MNQHVLKLPLVPTNLVLDYNTGQPDQNYVNIWRGYRRAVHRYLIYLDRARFTWSANNESPFIKCIQTGFMLLHLHLWLISEDKSLLKLVDMYLLKGDNKELTSAFQVFVFEGHNHLIQTQRDGDDPWSKVFNNRKLLESRKFRLG